MAISTSISYRGTLMNTSPTNTAPPALGRFHTSAATALALGILLYALYAIGRGLEDTALHLRNMQWSLYLAVLGLTLVNYGLRFLKWVYLLGRVEVSVPWALNLRIFITGLAMAITPAKAGELVKPYLLMKARDIPMTRTVPVLVSERLTDGLAVVILAAIGVGTHYAQATWLVFGVLALTVGLIIAFMVKPVGLFLLNTAAKLPGFRKFTPRIASSYMAMRSCLQPLPLALMLILSLVAWFAECVGMWLVFKGLLVPATLDISTFLYAFSTVFGAPAPGGLGMADVALVEGGLQLLADMNGGQAIAAALLIRVATLWFGVLMGAFLLLRLNRWLPGARPE